MFSGKRVCIFVDGENLRHSITELFPSPLFEKWSYLPKGDWSGFFDWIAQEAVGNEADRIRTYWYTVQNIDFIPYNLNSIKKNKSHLIKTLSKEKIIREKLENPGETNKQKILEQITEDLQKKQRMMEDRLFGWTHIQDEIARKDNAIEFRRAGSIKYNLYDGRLGKEKAVDVKLATDLIKLKDIYDVAIIVSGDQDYVPAVETIKDFGKRIVNVSFLTDKGKLLPGGAKRLNQATDWSIEVKYIDSKKYFNL